MDVVGRKRCPPFEPVSMCGGHATVAVPPWPCNRPHGQAAPVAVPCLLRVPVAVLVAVAAAVPGPVPVALAVAVWAGAPTHSPCGCGHSNIAFPTSLSTSREPSVYGVVGFQPPNPSSSLTLPRVQGIRTERRWGEPRGATHGILQWTETRVQR